MASLKKRGKVYYGQWQKLINGERINVTKSLGTHYKRIALKKMETLQGLEEEGSICPYQKDFQPQKVLEELNKPKITVQIYTMREAANYFYRLKAHLSSKTVRNDSQKRISKEGAYEQAVEHFIKFNDIGGQPPKHVDITHFEAVIFKANIKPATRWFYFKQLRVFWNTLLERKIVSDDSIFPTIKKNMPKRRASMRSKMLTEPELQQLFEAFDQEVQRKRQIPEWKEFYSQQWFKPVICCYFYGGLRKHEVAFSSDIPYSGLKGKNLYYDNGELSAIALEPTKGRNERLVPIATKWKEALKNYMNLRGNPDYEQYLFIYLGGPKKGWPVMGQRVYREFKRYLGLAGLPGERTLHGMRHGRITKWLETGYNTSEAQFMAGHSSSSVTNQYTHLTGKKLIEKMRRMEGNKKG